MWFGLKWGSYHMAVMSLGVSHSAHRSYDLTFHNLMQYEHLCVQPLDVLYDNDFTPIWNAFHAQNKVSMAKYLCCMLTEKVTIYNNTLVVMINLLVGFYYTSVAHLTNCHKHITEITEIYFLCAAKYFCCTYSQMCPPNFPTINEIASNSLGGINHMFW